jgi:AcrR family transcriptional regulator
MLRSMTRAPGTGRLSVDDWIQAGFAVLADDGPNAIRIGRLCEHLAVTKGSFYWHFTDIQAYRAALVEAWGDLRDADRRQLGRLREGDPRARLSAMMATLVDPRHWAVERAMRMWALTDERVAASVRHSDMRVLRAVRQALSDYGFADDEAAMRAAVMFWAGVGLLHSSDPTTDAPAEMRDRFLGFMLRP